MIGIISGFLSIKRLQNRHQQLELAYLDADLQLAKIENKLIDRERPEVRPHLAREFALSRAFRELGFKSKSTEDCIKMARLWAKATK